MTAQTFYQKLRALGPRKLWERLRRGLWSTGSTLLLVRPAGAPVDPFPSKPCIGELRLVTEDDLPDCAAFEDAAHYVPIYRDMLRRGDLIHFGYLNGKCVYRHAARVSGNLEFSGHALRRLGEKEIVTHFSHCAPEARGGGWQTESLREFFRARFDCTSYTFVLEDNLPSLISCFRAGYRPYSRLTDKNRFFRNTISEVPFSSEEAEALLKLALPRNTSVNIDKNTAPPPRNIVHFDELRLRTAYASAQNRERPVSGSSFLPNPPATAAVYERQGREVSV